MNGTATRHVVMLSGGKDSTALALYLRDRHPALFELAKGYEKVEQGYTWA